MWCPKCGKAWEGGYLFCGDDGTELVSEPPNLPVYEKKTKKCPFCAEEIISEATICRFCRIELSTGKSIDTISKAKPVEVQARSGVGDGVKLGFGMFIVLPLLIVLGGLIALVAFKEGGGGYVVGLIILIVAYIFIRPVADSWYQKEKRQ